MARALSVIQSWATLLVCGAKKLETRGWQTRYRGPLLVVSSRKFPDDCRRLCALEPFRTHLLERAGIQDAADLALGVVLGRVTLREITPTDTIAHLTEEEIAFGDYSPGRFAWEVSDPVMFPDPIPFRGYPGIYEVPDQLIANTALSKSVQ